MSGEGATDVDELSSESKAVLFGAGALWVAFAVVMLTRFIRRVLRSLSNLLGLGLDEDEMLGIKHHKKASSSSAPGGKAGKGKGGKAAGKGKVAKAAAAASESSDSEEEEKPIGLVRKGKSSAMGKRSVKSKSGGDEVSHRLHINTLKGHTDAVNMVSFSGDGKAIVTACDDMTVRLFRLDAVYSKNPHILRIPLDKERATGVTFAAPGAQGKGATDGIIAMGASPLGEASLTHYAISPTAPPTAKFQKKRAMDAKRSISLSCGGGGEGRGPSGAPVRVPPVVVSSSDETEIRVWSVDNGVEIARLDTLQFKNNNAAISPDGRFIAAAAFTADVKIWEVQRSKQGAPMSVDAKNAAMLLKGHRGAVQWVAFTPDAKGAVTVSKDKTMKLWNIDVRYVANEDPKVLASVDLGPEMTKATPLPTRVAVSSGGVIAVAFGTALVFYVRAEGGIRKLERVEGAHGGEEVIWAEWAPQPHAMDGGGEAEVLATAGADKKAKLWRSPR